MGGTMTDKHAYVDRNCLNCNSLFKGRRDRETNRWCSQKCFQQFIEQKNSYTLTAKDADIINGLLLSDGCISKSHANLNYYLTHTSIMESYSDFIQSNLSFPTRKSMRPGRKMSAKMGGCMGKDSYALRTGVSPVWTNLRQEWYPQGIKIVPKIPLTPTTCLHWYLGDGSLDNRTGIHLCTDSFDADSIKFLRENLHKLGFITLTNARNRVIIPNRSVYEFLEYIGMSPVPEFAYKWDTIVKESYRDRRCLQCETVFDAKVNHNVYCADKCYKLAWKRRQSRPVAVRKSG
jgi:hypothetical protein